MKAVAPRSTPSSSHMGAVPSQANCPRRAVRNTRVGVWNRNTPKAWGDSAFTVGISFSGSYSRENRPTRQMPAKITQRLMYCMDRLEFAGLQSSGLKASMTIRGTKLPSTAKR